MNNLAKRNNFKIWLLDCVKKNGAKYEFISNPGLMVLEKTVDLSIRFNAFLAKTYTSMWPLLRIKWFDHRFDYARGPQNYYWVERILYAMKRIRRGDVVLDIGCGDGMFDGLFYSQNSKKVDAIDIDPNAIRFAKRRYPNSNVAYHTSDPFLWLSKHSKYDVVIMYVVIYHFDKPTGLRLLNLIKKSLNDDGLFFGSTIILKSKNLYSSEHKNIFLSVGQLRMFLNSVFDRVRIYTSDWPDGRKECYFECRK